MSLDDPVNQQLDVIARLLETCGYAIEVDYPGATIIVWIENWPLLVQIKRQKAEIKRQKAKGKGQKWDSEAKPFLNFLNHLPPF